MHFVRLRGARLIEHGLRGLAAGLVVTVLLGFAGDLHPAFDTFGQFRAHASLALGVAAIALFVRRSTAAGLAALLVAAFGAYSVAPFMLPARPNEGGAPPGMPRYSLLQMNLRFDAPDPAAALSLIAQARPDVVTLQEMTPAWQSRFEKLSAAYPYRFYCFPTFLNGDVAILSRRPFREDGLPSDPGPTICDRRNKFGAKRIDFNGMPVTIGSLHLHWPWPGHQPGMLSALEPMFERFADPLIVAGDFNSAPWTAAVRRLAGASRTRVVAGVGPTWILNLLPPGLARYLGLPIDNVLVSDGIKVLDVRTVGPTSSDHLPVLVTFTMRFALPEEPDVRSAGR